MLVLGEKCSPPYVGLVRCAPRNDSNPSRVILLWRGIYNSFDLWSWRRSSGWKWARNLRSCGCPDLTPKSMRNRLIQTLYAIGLIGFWWSAAEAQTLRLQQAGGNSSRATVQVGQTITIEVFGNLGRVEASGVAFFITVPSGAFQVIDQGAESVVGVQPFLQGPLFQGAGEVSNLLLPESDPSASNFEGQQLDYAAVIGAAGQRTRGGAGVIASSGCFASVPSSTVELISTTTRSAKPV